MGGYIGGNKIMADKSYVINTYKETYTRDIVTQVSNKRGKISSECGQGGSSIHILFVIPSTVYLCDDIFGTNATETNLGSSSEYCPNIELEDAYALYTNGSGVGYAASASEYSNYLDIRHDFSNKGSGADIWIRATDPSGLPGYDGTIRIKGLCCFFKYNNKYIGFSSLPSIYSTNAYSDGSSIVSFSGAPIRTENITTISEYSKTRYSYAQVADGASVGFSSSSTSTSTITPAPSNSVLIMKSCTVKSNSTTSYTDLAGQTYRYSATADYTTVTNNTSQDIVTVTTRVLEER